jgi:hypothetical protein
VPLQETMKKGRAEARPYMGDDVIVGMGVDLAEVGRVLAAI